jgi:uncharacterized protein
MGYPYITPVNYIFLGGRIYFHSSPEGEKMDNLIRNPKVGFEVDIPLSYLGRRFNPENNPCRIHQLYHSVIIRGMARVITAGPQKLKVLNALVAKHEGLPSFDGLTADSPGYRACRVIEINPERITAKSELGQSYPQHTYHSLIVKELKERGLPEDLEALKAMEKIGIVHGEGKRIR